MSRFTGLRQVGAALFALTWAAFAGAQVPEAPAAPKFAIERFIVEGNTLLPAQQVEALVAPFRGPDRDFGTVQQALEALQDAYLARGFSAVRVLVPEQELRQGQVRLQVIEARLRKIDVEGNKYYSRDNIVAGFPTLRPGEPPNTRHISENVQLVNENPGKQATVVLEGTDEPGKADAIVRIADEPSTRTTLSLDNTGSPQTGMLRAGVGYQNMNVFDRDHVLSAQYVTSPTQSREVTIFGLGYRIPLYSKLGAIDLVAGYSNVNSGTVQGLFNVSGSGTILGARYTQMLPRIEAYDHKLAFALDYRAFKQNVTLVGTGTPLVPDVTVRPMSVSYLGHLGQVGNDISFVVSVSQNVPGMNDGGQAAFTAQRANAPARYRIYRAAGGWSYALPEDFLLRASGSLQYTKDPLIAGEQFGMGGQDSVRGFYERESASDTGRRGSLELYGPDFGKRVGESWRARVLGFYDIAQGHDVEPIRAGSNGLASVGVGLRMNQGKSLSIRLDAAAVTNRSATRPDNRGRIHFSLAYSF